MVRGPAQFVAIKGGIMSIRFYNTMSNRIEEFQEITKGKIGLYTCGPTVYDFAHIGNFRSYMFEDLVKRYFQYRGFKVKHIMNITDIDDKTIKKANQLNMTIQEVTGKYTEAFFQDIDTLNIIRADGYPRATDHIAEMIAIIEKLDENGYAYKMGDSVYFRIEKFADYGKLANINKDSLKMGTSVDSDEYDKENAQDFVLWKGRKEGEPSWDTKYGDGRPGWHIECSAMSTKYLGDHFDIHMGGVDNIFPHHENEIAQSCGASGKPFVNYWLHCQHLIIDNQKMSKSLGNFYTVTHLIEKGYDAMAIRLILLSTHYRKLLNFTIGGLEAAQQSLKRIKDFVFFIKNHPRTKGETAEISDLIQRSEEKFIEHMDDDFNISGALGTFFEFIHQINLKKDHLKEGDQANILEFVARINSVLGVLKVEDPKDLDAAIREKIALREKARKEKNFKLADEIRDQLKSEGVTLIDTPDGVRWKFIR
jgi:cysteinyl-tRNA synthetase